MTGAVGRLLARGATVLDQNGEDWPSKWTLTLSVKCYGEQGKGLTFAAVLVVGSDPAPVVNERSVVQEEGGGACSR